MPGAAAPGHRQHRGPGPVDGDFRSQARQAVESVIVPMTEGSNAIVSAAASRLACVTAARSEPGPESPVFITVITAGTTRLSKTLGTGEPVKGLATGRGGRGATSLSTPGGWVRRGVSVGLTARRAGPHDRRHGQSYPKLSEQANQALIGINVYEPSPGVWPRGAALVAR